MESSNQFKIFAGSKGMALAKGICEELGCQLGALHVDRFSDGEFCTYFEESVRGKSVYLVQSTCPTSDNLMELLLMIDAAKRASAYKVIAVIPYFGWARQDRKDKPRVSIGAKLVANMLQTAGADRVIHPCGSYLWFQCARSVRSLFEPEETDCRFAGCGRLKASF